MKKEGRSMPYSVPVEKLDFSLEKSMESCLPYSLSALARLKGYKDLQVRFEGFTNTKSLKDDRKKLWRICGCNLIQGSCQSMTSDNLKKYGYIATYYIDSEKRKKLIDGSPKGFTGSGMHTPPSDYDVFCQGKEDFEKSLHSNLESENPVIGIELVKDARNGGTHAILIIKEDEHSYAITDTYHCSEKQREDYAEDFIKSSDDINRNDRNMLHDINDFKPLKREHPENRQVIHIPKEELKNTLYGFITIERMHNNKRKN